MCTLVVEVYQMVDLVVWSVLRSLLPGFLYSVLC